MARGLKITNAFADTWNMTEKYTIGKGQSEGTVMDQLPHTSSASDEELAKELVAFRILRPYIAHCLSLNHDVNNALAGVVGYCEFLLLDEDNLDEKQLSYVQKIMLSANRIEKMIEELCKAKMALREKVDLKALLDQYSQVDQPSE